MTTFEEARQNIDLMHISGSFPMCLQLASGATSARVMSLSGREPEPGDIIYVRHDEASVQRGSDGWPDGPDLPRAVFVELLGGVGGGPPASRARAARYFSYVPLTVKSFVAEDSYLEFLEVWYFESGLLTAVFV